MKVPERLIYPSEPFVESFRQRCDAGALALAGSSVAFVGLARNCAVRLAENLRRLEYLSRCCRSWSLHIETNDNADQTPSVLQAFVEAFPQASFTNQTLGREQFSAEFSGPRTIALAEYRTACQTWVREHAADADYVVAIDWDQWGGWSHAGVMSGIGWLAEKPDAYGMASVSLNEFTTLGMGEDRQPKIGKGWTHYDAWALRGVGQADCHWDDYTAGQGGWKHQWLPPVGSPPVLVASAFGGLCIYRTAAFLQGNYAGETDCEHVPFHRSIAQATRQRLFLNPSQRCVMAWMSDDEGHHGDD